ncbi:hypothetical protein B484DRAFT_12925, partial [Ochromonadaceae sp. CCMP2298]
ATAKRRRVRHKLEKNVARCWANKQPPLVWKRPNTLPDGAPNVVVQESAWAKSLGYEIVDGVEYYSRYLTALNLSVEQQQQRFFEQRQLLDEYDESRVLQVKAHLEKHTLGAINEMSRVMGAGMDMGAQAAGWALEDSLTQLLGKTTHRLSVLEDGGDAAKMWAHMDSFAEGQGGQGQIQGQ